MDNNLKAYMNTLMSVLASSLTPKLEDILEAQPIGWFAYNVLSLVIIIFLIVLLLLLNTLRSKVNAVFEKIDTISSSSVNSSNFFPMEQDVSIEINPVKPSCSKEYRDPEPIISEDSTNASLSSLQQQGNNFYQDGIYQEKINAVIKSKMEANNHFLARQMSSPYNPY